MSEASITWISGPVLRAATEDVFHINEAVFVGQKKLLGEIIRIEQNTIVAQAYEDTSGLRPGDKVVGNGMPLSVKLGPALLGNIFDGLLRPLTIDMGDYVQPGMQAPPAQTFEFTPGIKDGDQAPAGSVLGTATSAGGLSQAVLVPPHVSGTVAAISPQGHYNDEEAICTLKDQSGTEHTLAMSHQWPIRDPRPVAERLPTSRPLFTGQRILDSIFPLACGGRAAMPGGFGTGKTVLQETLSKWCDADIIIYVGCGERGNEMAGVLHDLPALEDPRTGRPLMERTLIIANTSNMPVAAREASIYTAVTVAEYFRDQGLRVSLMADSTSRWAEALREV
jgi:V/A-type H+-transporting ATPase subunit A